MREWIHVEELKIGMYIRIQGSWLSHPFAKSEFLIKSSKDIQKIADAGLKKILVDFSKSKIDLALFLAEILNQKIKFMGAFRGAFFLPVIVSGVVVTILWQQLYGFDMGLLNRLLTGIGLGKIGWLTDPNISMASIAVMATWKNVGLYIVLFLVGLQTVPIQYYEAADLEGANHLQKFFRITLPMIKPTIFMVVILSTIGGFSLFIEPYIMTGGGPLNSTMSAVLYIYKQGFFYYHMGYAATLGLFFALIILAVVMIQKRNSLRKTIEKN